MLRFYVEVARTAFRRQLIYRWANIAGLLTNVFFGAISSYVLIALYHARPMAAGYSLSDSLRYVWLLQAMIMVVLPFGWFDLMLTIRTGEVVADLSKPCDFYWYWFSREAGRAVYYLLFRALPAYLGGMLLFGVTVPAEARVWLLSALTFSLGAAIGIAFRFLYNMTAFWLVEARPVGTMAASVALFFAGLYFPLPLFPDWLRAIAYWLPFNGLMNVAAQIFVGKENGPLLALDLTRQALWLVALTLVARLITGLAMRRVVSQGG